MSAAQRGPSGRIGSHTLAHHLGVTYRQLDYAVRSVPSLATAPSMAAGSGSRRRFDADAVVRLAVAAALARSGGDMAGQWLSAVKATMQGPTPPRRGIALFTASGVEYFQDRLVLPVDGPPGAVGILVRYDIDLADFGIVEQAA